MCLDYKIRTAIKGRRRLDECTAQGSSSEKVCCVVEIGCEFPFPIKPGFFTRIEDGILIVEVVVCRCPNCSLRGFLLC